MFIRHSFNPVLGCIDKVWLWNPAFWPKNLPVLETSQSRPTVQT